MQSFSQFVVEASAPGKNVHMTHIEDSVIYSGVNGAREAINALRSLRDTLAGSSNNATDVSVKWDGAPAVFAGTDPTDGKFFVAKKGIFNKNPVVYKSHADIDADTTGDLAKKLKVAYDELSGLGIKGIVQGDIMFTKGDVKTETIDGDKYVTFHPNTIVYAVPEDSETGKKIKSAKLGIVFHTTYTGKSFESLKASYGVNVTGFKKTPSVWYQDAVLHDLSGTATMTSHETAEVTAALSLAGTIFQKISGTTLRAIESDSELASMIEQFNNTLVRKGESISSPRTHVTKLIAWMKEKFAKEAAARKTEAGKQAVDAKLNHRLQFFSAENLPNLELVFELQNALIVAKNLLISKLSKLTSMSTFLRTSDGFKVTKHEGFVAIDHLKGGAVKLVDRLAFSYANFNPEIIKGWQR